MKKGTSTQLLCGRRDVRVVMCSEGKRSTMELASARKMWPSVET